MINWILRGILILWAAFFGLTGFQGLIADAPYAEMFGVTGGDTGINTLRADLSAFFLVAAAGALVGALRPGASRALLVPAALFGTAFVGRATGLVLGDPLTAQISQAMIAEAISTVLMLGAMWQLSRPATTAIDPAASSAGPAHADFGGDGGGD
jgi:hypothetical protein